MRKNSKRNVRTVNLADFWDPEMASQSAATSGHAASQYNRRRYSRPPPPRPVVDPQALKRAYMLQHFQFILRADLLTLRGSAGGGTLPQGQRRLIECIRSADSLVPWTAVYSVVQRTTLQEFECPICLDTPTAPRITECGHVFCMSCILQYMSLRKQSDQPRTCPVCHSLIGVFMLRPVVLQPIVPLKVSSSQGSSSTCEDVVRFDLFRRERNSCILHRYDDPRLTSEGRAPAFAIGEPHAPARSTGQQNSGGSGGPSSCHLTPIELEVCLPSYDEPCAVQSRYVFSTPAYEATQRYLDGASISEKLHDVELLERPLSQFDAAEEQFLLEALNEVTKEPEALAPSLLKNSPPIAPRPTTSTANARPSALSRLDDPTNPANRNPSNANPVYEIYAEGSGQPYYLHMVSVKMLKHDAKLRGQPLPDSVSGRILDMVSFTQDEESRRIYKVFAHVPLHGSIQLCLLDLSDTVLPETMAAFKATLEDMERRRQAQRRADAASDNGADASWQAYLKRYAAHRYDSPAILPSDLSFETADDSAPFLQLPSAGEAWEDHGLPPNTLDTRQRATKRQECGPDSLVPQPPTAGAVTLANLATLTSSTGAMHDRDGLDNAPSGRHHLDPMGSPPQQAQGLTQTSTGTASHSGGTSTTNNKCWGGGSAAKLFRSSQGNLSGAASSSSAVVPTWGGHDFTPNRNHHHHNSTPASGNGNGSHTVHHGNTKGANKGTSGNTSVGNSPALGAASAPRTPQQPPHHPKGKSPKATGGRP